MDVGSWLRRLGIERYEAVFRDNEIDDAVLPRLTAEDLKDLGVGPVGHRRKLLDAIAALRAESSGSAPSPEVIPDSDQAATDSAERRHVTVSSRTLLARPHFPLAWTQKICARSFRPIRRASSVIPPISRKSPSPAGTRQVTLSSWTLKRS
jgi:hypothetical protein